MNNKEDLYTITLTEEEQKKFYEILTSLPPLKKEQVEKLKKLMSSTQLRSRVEEEEMKKAYSDYADGLTEEDHEENRNDNLIMSQSLFNDEDEIDDWYPGWEDEEEETAYLSSIPGMKESIEQGIAEPIDSCSRELDWDLEDEDYVFGWDDEEEDDLDRALQEVHDDIANGDYKIESVDEHMKRVTGEDDK